MDAAIVHICPRSDWEAARASGRYSAPSLAAEGFIHLAAVEQVVACGNALFPGATDLVLLCVAVGRLEAPLRYETDEGGETFPHLYGPLNLDAVVAVAPFVSDEDGFVLPAELGGARSPGSPSA